jgi:spore coat protein U-like protein
MVGIHGSKLRLLAAASSVLLAAGLPSAAIAGTQTTSMNVTATVADDCSVTATSVAFGSINVTSATAPTATGGITVRCTAGTAWTATASAGNGVGATPTLRKMRHSVDTSKTLNYSLFVDSGYVTVWGDGSTGSGITGTGIGANDTRTIYARVPTGQGGATQGSYADAVTVTVTY